MKSLGSNPSAPGIGMISFRQLASHFKMFVHQLDSLGGGCQQRSVVEKTRSVKKDRVLTKLEKMTLFEEEDVMQFSTHKRPLQKVWDFFFFLHIFAGERKCNELQQEEFRATDALKKIVLDG